MARFSRHQEILLTVNVIFYRLVGNFGRNKNKVWLFTVKTYSQTNFEDIPNGVTSKDKTMWLAHLTKPPLSIADITRSGGVHGRRISTDARARQLRDRALLLAHHCPTARELDQVLWRVCEMLVVVPRDWLLPTRCFTTSATASLFLWSPYAMTSSLIDVIALAITYVGATSDTTKSQSSSGLRWVCVQTCVGCVCKRILDVCANVFWVCVCKRVQGVCVNMCWSLLMRPLRKS